MHEPLHDPEGILPIVKPPQKTSFGMVHLMRKITHVRKIGHAGTLDPFATGVLILLIGKKYTRLSDTFLNQDKEYRARLHLGITTESHDPEGAITSQNPLIPSQQEIDQVLSQFQGTISQIPPMFSAKKRGGQRLYLLARKGIEIPREPIDVTVSIKQIAYLYPHLDIEVTCSKGTYIRQLAYDIGDALGCGAHLSALERTRSGKFSLADCCTVEQLMNPSYSWQQHLRS